jgi:hypothetical protein
MKTFVSLPIFVLLLGAVGVSARADTIGYDVIVDTSSVFGDYGYIDLQLLLIPNNIVLPLTATVSGFTGDATLNSSDPSNDEINASGSLPDPVTLTDTTSTDYFEGLTFGNSIVFDVTLDGPGVSLDGGLTADSGSTFSLTFYESDGVTPLFASGSSAEIDVAPDGTVTAESDAGNVQVVPEPSTLPLIAGAGLLAFAFRRMGRKAWRFR